MMCILSSNGRCPSSKMWGGGASPASTRASMGAAGTSIAVVMLLLIMRATVSSPALISRGHAHHPPLGTDGPPAPPTALSLRQRRQACIWASCTHCTTVNAQLPLHGAHPCLSSPNNGSPSSIPAPQVSPIAVYMSICMLYTPRCCPGPLPSRAVLHTSSKRDTNSRNRAYLVDGGECGAAWGRNLIVCTHFPRSEVSQRGGATREASGRRERGDKSQIRLLCPRERRSLVVSDVGYDSTLRS